MGLIKLIFLALLVWFALRLWRGLQRQQATQRQQQSARAQQEPPLMVRCAQCHVPLPQDSALRANDHWYCCAEHRDEHSQH